MKIFNKIKKIPNREEIIKILSGIIALILIYYIAKFSVFSSAEDVKNRTIFPIILLIIFLSSSRKAFWLLCFPFVLIHAIYLPIGAGFGKINHTFLESLENTNTGEIIEFIQLIPSKYFLITFFMISGIILYRIILTKTGIALWKNKFLIITLLLVTLSKSSAFKFPNELTDAIQAFAHEREKLQRIDKNVSWEITDVNSKYENYVLIIGESARKDYHGAYGYPVNNTPFMSQSPGVLVDGLTSPAPNTVASLKIMLTDSDKELVSPRYNMNFVKLANQAGFDTTWISNQGNFGIYDTAISFIANQSKTKFFLKKDGYDSINTDDFSLLPIFEKVINTPSSHPARLFVLHLMGSHPSTCERLHDYPNHYLTDDKKYLDLGCYLASIEKTDKLIARVHDILKERFIKNNEKFSIIYFSDHGLSSKILDDGYISMRHLNTREQYSVPLFKISSDDTQRTVIKNFKSGLNMTLGLSTWLGIKTRNHINKYSLFAEKIDDQDYGYIEKLQKLPSNPLIDITPHLAKNVNRTNLTEH